MKIPIKLTCDACSKQFVSFPHVLDGSFEAKCGCGETKHPSFDNGFTIGFKILLKSSYAFAEERDFEMSVVYAASAVDCELSRLHNKWKRINSFPAREPSREELHKALAGYRNIFKKIKETAKLMYPKGFTQFVVGNSELSNTIQTGFPSLKFQTLISDIHGKLFRPRNKVLHASDERISEQQAIVAYNTATLALRILAKMDKYKRAIRNAT